MSAPPPLCCPDCFAPLRTGVPDRLTCLGCSVSYEVVAGIPDLRPPVAGFDRAGDRTLALELAEQPLELSFETLLRRYWAAQPEVAPGLVERFVAGDLHGGDRAGEVAAQIAGMVGAEVLDGALVLEIGCGTAALGVALAARADHVVVSDVALSWLVLARRRLVEAGISNASVVACTGDRLPFATATFDLVAAADVIEHVPDPAGMVACCHAVVRPGGALWLSTPNRLSLTPEPHVRLWAVGWLPRSVALAYVRRLRGVDYSTIRTLSLRSLRRTLVATGSSARVVAPPIAQAVRSGYRPSSQRIIDLYDRLRRVPVVSSVILRITPLFHATVRKR